MKFPILTVCICGLAASSLPIAAQPGVSASANRAVQPEARITDRIIREVRHELVMLPYYGVFDDLSYKAEGGTVTLIGEVTQPTLKSGAESAVKDIEGVDRVDNQIRVLPLSDTDDRIRLAAYRAIYGDQTLGRYALQAVPPIHIIVNNGRVKLVGVVRTTQEKDLANLRARGVAGAFEVQNDLSVESPR